MPNAPQKPCPQPYCPHLQPCPVHVRAAWRGTAPAPPRIRGGQLQALRQALFQREPLCRVCAGLGRVTIATIRDHIIPLAELGTEDESNIQPICQPCHDVKIREEAKRGMQRGGPMVGPRPDGTVRDVSLRIRTPEEVAASMCAISKSRRRRGV